MGRPIKRKNFTSVFVTSVTRVNSGNAYDIGNTITFSGAGWTTPLILTVTGNVEPGNNAITSESVTQVGVRNSALPTNPVAGVTGIGTGADANGVNATFNLTWSGVLGHPRDQGNSIKMIAHLQGAGGPFRVDIIKQISSRRYLVTDGTRTGVVTLSSAFADRVGECSVAVLDSAGGQYFATKIAQHKVTLTRAGGSGHLYATGGSAPWLFDAPADIYVQIAND
jgi:hypothetical protein